MPCCCIPGLLRLPLVPSSLIITTSACFPQPYWLQSRRTSYLHRGLSQGGNRITVEDLLTGFLFAYDVVMSGLWHGQSRLPTEVHRSALSASRWTSVGLGQSKGVRGTAAARARRRLRQVDDGRVPIVPTRTTRGEVIATVAVVPSALGDVEVVPVAVLQGSRLGERLSAITSRRSKKDCGAASLSARRRWRSRMRFRPRPRSRIV